MQKAAQQETRPANRRRGTAVRRRGTSPEKTAQTRQAIVDAALAEFVEKGFADATIESVAKRAGVAKGLIYRYFEAKEALFSAVVQQEIVHAHIDVDDSRGRPARASRRSCGERSSRLFTTSTRRAARS